MTNLREVTMTKVEEKKIDIDLIKKTYDDMAQAYHLLANLHHKDRHISSNWKSCNEITCIRTKNQLMMCGIVFDE